MAKWDKSQPGNSQPSSLIGTCLTLPNLGFLWVFFKYPKITKNGNPLFFPMGKARNRQFLNFWPYNINWKSHLRCENWDLGYQFSEIKTQLSLDRVVQFLFCKILYYLSKLHFSNRRVYSRSTCNNSNSLSK